jgi:hypothetical protein
MFVVIVVIHGTVRMPIQILLPLEFVFASSSFYLFGIEHIYYVALIEITHFGPFWSLTSFYSYLLTRLAGLHVNQVCIKSATKHYSKKCC